MSQTPDAAQSRPPIYFVLFHTPGPQWLAGAGFREQPGVMEHVSYMGRFLAGGQLFMGGPFLDDTGGMMILRADNAEQAQRIADADPSVQGGLLQVTVRPWLAAMQAGD